jgi:hypothetical protein
VLAHPSEQFAFLIRPPAASGEFVRGDVAGSRIARSRQRRPIWYAHELWVRFKAELVLTAVKGGWFAMAVRTAIC